MVVVGELILSAVIQMLVQQLLYPELVKFANREGIGRKLREWKKTLSRIQKVLDDAENRQENNDREVKQWLDDLKDLAYDVDDILDEFNTEVLRSKSMGENLASTSKVRNLIPACCTGLTPSAVKMNIRLGPKIKEITDRFNEIVKQKDDLNLRETVGGRRPNRERERLQPTSVMYEARIGGREKDKENVVKLLLTENSSGVGVGVVSIVGMGGMAEQFYCRYGKSKLDRLVLEWSPRSQNRRSDEFEFVLNMLRPNNSLKELTIENYGGTKFPTWLGGPSFPNMVVLRIENCKSCTSLPPVGQLASLKDLFIRGMAAVKNVGLEFYGEGCSQPFKSLEKLSFSDMEEWEHWTPPGELPRLRDLFIHNCPKLLGKLPDHLPSLETVRIRSCWNLVVPEHFELDMDDSEAIVCKFMVDFSYLHISKFTPQIEGLNMERLTNVEDLCIKSCEEMKPLWTNEVGLLRHLPRLRSLNIQECPRLVSLVAEEVEEQLPYTVKQIKIRHCEVLQSLPKSMMYNNTCLESIYLCKCDSLTHFARGQLPPTLKTLLIIECANLRILLDGDDDDINSCGSTSLLENLNIKGCGSLKCLTLSGELPATLKSLFIRSCGQLESVAKRFPHNSLLEKIYIGYCDNLKSLPMGLDSLAHLNENSIWCCPNLVLFQDGESLPTNLGELSLVKCDKMQGLPNNMHNLTSLQNLEIKECPRLSFPKEGFPLYLTSFVIDKMQGLPNNIHNLTSLQNLEIKGCPGLSFPEEGFPPNLTSLTIRDFNMALFGWGLQLHNLTSIKALRIYGGSSHLISFPEMMLPASLTSLTIRDFPNLESLSSKGFQMLTSLEHLTIWNCRKLSSLPKDGLPPTILSLQVYNCPLLKERWKKEGQERSKIANVPCVKFDLEIFKF